MEKRERYTFFSKSSKNIHLFYIRSSDIIYTRRTHLVHISGEKDTQSVIMKEKKYMVIIFSSQC